MVGGTNPVETPGNTVDRPSGRDIDQFILDEIETVPHLEALLLLWRERPRRWTEEAMAKALYVPQQTVREILQDLVKRNLIASTGDAGHEPEYEFNNAEKEKLVKSLDLAYRRELIRISRLIHSKASPGVREFARAFRLKKDRE
jgi:DNA-binding MarR family transcriptional regulator